eukprot:gnl/Dysnectes_brevis/2843_a3470_921.p1 GENE.gnl/Dysnectes_brevis/2843_a3470_921~~gnl/Dysnectes_brevis/2843_a3470_921.p1  ORF type:complete len:568 (+),score=134.46 gnl/Dysnectes_brevis/2843_a3470_921:74-1705(+)
MIFDFVSFDLDNPTEPTTLFKLLMAKHLFCMALPRMPKDYITRLVFNHHHETILLMEHPIQHSDSIGAPTGIGAASQQYTPLVGAICFRRFYNNNFVEIAFCAVNTTRQGKGYGRILMDRLKEHVKRFEVTEILTYADKFALDYFKKQGFSTTIRMPKTRYEGRIKHYDAAVFVECRLYSCINYTELASRIRSQIEATIDRVGIKPVRIDDPAKRSVEAVPGLLHAAKLTGRGKPSVASPAEVKRVCDAAKYAITVEAPKRYGLPFVDVPADVEYRKRVPDSLCLREVARRVDAGFYRTPAMFRAHITQLEGQCRSYNGPKDERTLLATQLVKGLRESFDNAYRRQRHGPKGNGILPQELLESSHWYEWRTQEIERLQAERAAAAPPPQSVAVVPSVECDVAMSESSADLDLTSMLNQAEQETTRQLSALGIIDTPKPALDQQGKRGPGIPAGDPVEEVLDADALMDAEPLELEATAGTITTSRDTPMDEAPGDSTVAGADKKPTSPITIPPTSPQSPRSPSSPPSSHSTFMPSPSASSSAPL